MRIYIERYSDKEHFDGKSLFCNRLGRELSSRGILVTGNDGMSVDVSLNIVKLKHERSDIKVLRLDGVCFDRQVNFRRKNLELRKSARGADGVIYQSQFSKSMCDTFLGVACCPHTIIYNGADLKFYEDVRPAKVNHKNVFLAVSRWRVFKRLEETIQCFVAAGVDDSVLYVAGHLKDSGINAYKYDHTPNVIFLGEVNQKTLASYFKVAKASIHLSWFDSCPNSVVEAVAARVPVICGNIAGPKEIVIPSGGYCCEIDEPYKYNTVDVYNPPPINKDEVITAMRLCAKEELDIMNSHVDIKHIADKYLQFFKSLLGKVK
jgi:glycosyltransferase involved in cell wall biosynthesis